MVKKRKKSKPAHRQVTEYLTLRVTPILRDQVAQLAVNEDRTIASMIRVLIERGLKENGNGRSS